MMDSLVQNIRRFRLQLGAGLSALSGALIAVGAHPVLQVPVESGQVLAGIVTYPADNPFYVYHLKLWTLLNQLSAFLLSAGVSELDASLLLEGLTGALSFAALFLFSHAVSGRFVVAFFTPLFLSFFGLVGIDIAYPIWLLGTTHTYGIFGLSYAVLVVGLLGVGWLGTGAFLAGLAPAFHPSLGAFCVVVAASAVAINRKAFGPELPRILAYFIAGAVLTGASLLWQLHFASLASGGDPSQQKRYLDAFIRNIDYHRSFSGWGHSGLFLGVTVAALALRTRFKYAADRGVKLTLDAVAASVAAAVIAAFLADFVPLLDSLKILIPWRYMNFANLCSVPVVLGLLAAGYTPLPRFRSFLLPAAAVILAGWCSLSDSPDAARYFAVALGTACIIALPLRDLPPRWFIPSLKWQNALAAAACAVLVLMTVVPAARSLITRDRGRFAEILRFASTRPGMLLTAGEMHLVQLQTRRPVLMDGGGLDMFPLVPETGPRFDEILKKAYGLDIFHPPDDERNRAKISFSHQGLWEERSPGEWRKIREEFGVTDVLTPAGWNLRLPLIADDGEISLYTIP